MMETKKSNPASEDVRMSETVPDFGRKPFVRFLMQALWPAFLGAAMSVGLIFSVVDPLQIDLVHDVLNDSREAAYTVSFIAFWILYSMVCGLTWYLASTDSRKG